MSRELDVVVAEKVMGWPRESLVWDGQVDGWWADELSGASRDGRFNPSTEISAAWEVVDKMRYGGAEVYIESMDDKWWCCFAMDPDNMDSWATSDAAELPKAICRAALEAIK